MAKKDIEQPQQTMEDFLLAQLNEEVILKDGTQLKAAEEPETPSGGGSNGGGNNGGGELEG